MTSGEGGMVTTDDDAVAEEARVLRNHGMRRRYYHDELGYNLRMTDIHAAIGLAQLQKLPRPQCQAPRERRLLRCAFEGRRYALRSQGMWHIYHQYTIRVPMASVTLCAII
jgi:dTDP-4-amino-4,6-dideoxygalactose transaminase